MKLLLLLISLHSLLFASYPSTRGEKIYKETCISCHGREGKAQTDVQLVVKPRSLHKSILTKKQMFEIIKNGAHDFGSRSDIMPSFKYVYSDAEIASVAQYISENFNPNIEKKLQELLQDSDTKATLTTGEKIFKKRCAKCHGKNGNGESRYVELSKTNSTFIYPYNLQKIILTEKQIFLFAKYGGKYWGSHKDDMPAWSIKYNDYQLKSVARYVEEKIKN